MVCSIAEALKDPLTHYKNLPKYTGLPLKDILSKDLPESKVLCRESVGSIDWHRHMQQRGPKSEQYVVYNVAMCDFEERKCLK